MSGGAVAVAVLGIALGVGITGCMAREIRRRRAAAETDEIMLMGATRPVRQVSPSTHDESIAAEFERGYRALTAYLSQQARSGGSSQSAD
ncbi:MAG: hypothetical protein ACXV3F_16380 [Frankiaceae bacterium]